MQIGFREAYPTEAQVLCDVIEHQSKTRIRSLNDIGEIAMTGHELFSIAREYHEEITTMEKFKIAVTRAK